MDPRERKQILGQWGVRDPNTREARESERLQRDLEGSPVQGQRLRVRARNFRPSVDSYVVSLGGPLPYMQRLAEIDRLTDLLKEGLREEWRRLAAALRDQAEEFSAAWQRAAEGWRYRELNELIDRHNTYFPVEARLPMDVRRRDYALINGKPYERPRVGAAWALERFPPELNTALPSRAASAEAVAPR
jgi:hypothetical protein